MNELQIFENSEFGQVRTVTIDGEPWFVGKDIARALGYGEGKSLNNAVANHVDEEDKGVTEIVTPGGKQSMTIINESGLYALIFGSKFESAKKFKHWVTSEVLPSIRKTGGYLSEADTKVLSMIESQQQFMERQQQFYERQERLSQMMIEKLENLSRIQIQQPINHEADCFSTCIGEKDELQGRREKLDRLVDEMAEACKWEKNFALHRLYKTLEKMLDISMDDYKKVYQAETGKVCASTWKVVTDSDRLYEMAVILCQNTINGMRC